MKSMVRMLVVNRRPCAGIRRCLRSVPSHVAAPSYATTGRVATPNFYQNLEKDPALQDAETIEKLRVAARLAREVLDLACRVTVPGMTGNDVDKIVHEATISLGAYPAPLNYMGFPKSVCSSKNEVCCHGIPDDVPFVHGDIVSFDVSLYKDGVFGDNCATIVVSSEKKEATSTAERDAERLIDACRDSLDAAIKAIGPGVCLTTVGNTIADLVEPKGYGIVKEYCGHGIGTSFHTAPLVQAIRNTDAFTLRPGHVFTIEPIITERPTGLYVADDNWTVCATEKDVRSAQFEHMILITENGAEVLTVTDSQIDIV